MPLKTYRPTSPGRRQMTGYDFAEITKSKPEKSLLRKQSKSGGHNVNGHYTARRKSGGHKRRYRLVDFHRDKVGIAAKVSAIEYDPNRTARIALLQYADGEKRYIVAPDGITVGTQLMSGPDADMEPEEAAKHIYNLAISKPETGQFWFKGQKFPWSALTSKEVIFFWATYFKS